MEASGGVNQSTARGDGPPIIHALLVSYPGQGHVNPLLRLGKRLAAEGLLVTLSTTKAFGALIRAANAIPEGRAEPVGRGSIRFDFFDDGLPHDDPRRADFAFYISQLERAGRPSVAALIAAQSVPVTCVVNNPFVPWACDVAEDLGLPCATLWVQSCAVFASYYHYFHKTVPFPSEAEPEVDVKLPGLPVLKHDEVPSFLYPGHRYRAFGELILGQFKNLSKSFCVLADTFQELESDAVGEISRLCHVRPIGPLFLGPKPAGGDVSGDLMQPTGDCVAWLDGKAAASVVYISFGTIVYLKQEQVEEIAHALLRSGVSFLWVVMPPPKETGLERHALPEGFVEEARERGKVVEWSPQEEVLAHPAVGCFVTHCGWNSSVEALASGVTVVALPQWGDQVTNAKFLVDVFGVGVRMGRGELEEGVVGREEVERRVREAMEGEKAAEMRRNAARWKKAAAEAVAEGGSSDRNLAEFVGEIRKRSRGILMA